MVKKIIYELLFRLVTKYLPPTKEWDTGFGQTYKEWDYILFRAEERTRVTKFRNKEEMKAYIKSHSKENPNA